MTQVTVIPAKFKNKLKFTTQADEFVIETSIPAPYNWSDLTLDEKLTAKDYKIVKTILKEYKKGQQMSEEEFFSELKK